MDKVEACGIEVSATELVVAWEGSKGGTSLRRFANTATGQRALLRALTRGGKRVRVVLEATGLYGLDVALALSAQPGVEVIVANPRAVRHFAQALMQRSKNDQLDAVVLREFAARMPFTPWARPTENALALWAIARRLEALTALCTAEKNRQHATGCRRPFPTVCGGISRGVYNFTSGPGSNCGNKRCNASQRMSCSRNGTGYCGAFPVSENAAPSRCWQNSCCCPPIATYGSGWPTPGWIRGNIIREPRCTSTRAVAN